MSELLDEQVNSQKKKAFRVHTSSCKPIKKCVMKMKQTNKEEKNDAYVKLLLMEGSPYKA